MASYGYRPLMTVLVGSQNYDLQTKSSDYDTFTLILPSINSITRLSEPVSVTHADDYGHINIKDIRLALNLLVKTSPNSVEMFYTKFKYITPGFEWLDHFPAYAFRCNPKHMLDAIGGMSHQLRTRNMSSGKRLSHVLRMHSMLHRFFELDEDLLAVDDNVKELAIEAKLNQDKPAWDRLIDSYETSIQKLIKEYDPEVLSKEARKAAQFITELQEKVANSILGQTKIEKSNHPVKPTYVKENTSFYCPNCGNRIICVVNENDKGRLSVNYCSTCGSEINWFEDRSFALLSASEEMIQKLKDGQENPTVYYDEADCDSVCLCEDIKSYLQSGL